MKDKPDVIEKVVDIWRSTDKYPCPKCGKMLGLPEYKCGGCNIMLKIRINIKY